MKSKILSEMEKYFGRDRRRINHARRVLDYAGRILEREPGDRQVVEAAAILHDIGIHAAEKRHGSTAGRFQEIEGPPIAEHILNRVGFPGEKMAEVLAIIAHHHTPGKVNTLNFKILYDADWLVNLRDEVGADDREKLSRTIEKVFLTAAGREFARQEYLG